MQIDSEGIHDFYNLKNYDLNCATIDPIEKIKNIANKNNIKLIDPIPYIRTNFKDRIKEGNFRPFYLPGDENHFNEITGEYLSDYLYFSVFKS